MKKILLLVAGGIFLVLGIIGIVLPVVPQVPFLLVSFLCFAKSSKRLKLWFQDTRIYRKYLKDVVEKKGMSRKHKLLSILLFTLTTGVALYFLWEFLAARIFLCVVWFFYVLYFLLVLKTV